MKLALQLIILALLALLGAAATGEQKPVIVSYPKDTPQSVLEKAMEAIKEAVRSDSLPLLLTSQSLICSIRAA
jgi:hypothetical protein